MRPPAAPRRPGSPLAAGPALAAAADAGAAHAGEPGRPWQVLRELGDASPWREVVDEYTGDGEPLPRAPLQRVRRASCPTCSASSTARRARRGAERQRRRLADARVPPPRHRRVRVVARPGDAPITLEVDPRRPLLLLRRRRRDPRRRGRRRRPALAQAQELLYRFGRAYPAGWDAHGRALHCLAQRRMARTRDGTVLARSDSSTASRSWRTSREHRAPRIAAHWAFLLEPLVQPTIPTSRARCATGRSSTTACR